MCSMLPYGTGICCYACIEKNCLTIASVHSFFILFKNLVLINQRIGPRYQRVLALCALSAGVILKGLILRKFRVRCLCVLCKFVSVLILWFMDNFWFDDLRAE